MSGTQEQQYGDEAGAGETRRSTVETSASHTFVLDRREAIPIIFVPGIMGSRLRARRTGRTVWDPDGKWFMLRTFFFAGAAKRKRLLVGQRFSPDFIEPISTGPWTATEASPAPKPVRRNKHGRRKPRGFRGTTGRGASGVLWMTYGDFLTRLYSAELVRTMWPADVAQNFYLPVYGFGYNWSASCKDAGQRLVTEARALIQAWKARAGVPVAM